VTRLADCLSDEVQLEAFIAFSRYRPVGATASPQIYDYAAKFFQKNLKLLRKKAAFQDLLKNEPKLALLLLNDMVNDIE
jgi:hypothetical protein